MYWLNIADPNVVVICLTAIICWTELMLMVLFKKASISVNKDVEVVVP